MMNKYFLRMAWYLAPVFLCYVGVAGARAQGEFTFVASAAAGAESYREPSTGLDLPAVLGGMKRGQERDFGDARLGRSIGYHSQSMAVTVYFYNLGLRDIPDGVSAPVKKEIESNKAEIFGAQQQGRYQAVKMRSQQEIRLGGTNGPAALQVLLEIRQKDANHLSRIYLLGYKNQFVKLRCTYAEEYQTVCEGVLQQFLGDFGSLLMGRPVVSEPLPEKQTASPKDVLAAIEVFRRNPVTREARDATRELIRFAEESDRVTVSLSPALLPWMNEKKRDSKSPLLLAAFVAGSVKSQLQNQADRDGALAGLVQVIETYQQLKESDAGFKMPDVEKLVELQKAGKLPDHVRALRKK